MTGIIWKENFDCEPKPKELPMLLPIILVTILCIVLTYTCEPFIIPRLFPSVGQTIGVVQQDIYDGETIDNTEEEEMIQGNFEVIPGVTANEYIERFREYGEAETNSHNHTAFKVHCARWQKEPPHTNPRKVKIALNKCSPCEYFDNVPRRDTRTTFHNL